MAGWNRKRLFRAAKAGLIPGTIEPKSSHGGRSAGYRFTLTPDLKRWIKENNGTRRDIVRLFLRNFIFGDS